MFNATLGTLVGAAARDSRADMIDRSVIRAHHCAVGIKGLARPIRGGFITKLHAVAMSEVARSSPS